MLPNISRSKGNQTLKLGQVVEYNNRNIFFKYHAENEAGRLVPDLFFFFRKALYELKASGLQLSSHHFRQSSTWQTIKTKQIKLQNIDPDICSILIFQKKVWELFLHHSLCIIFQEKYFLCYTLLTDHFFFFLISNFLYFH